MLIIPHPRIILKPNHTEWRNSQLNISELMDRDTRCDRRQRKTRSAIRNALLELLKDKPLESITVSELAQNADINRKTFYNNYTCIADVAEEINRRIITHIFQTLPKQITISNEIEIYHLLLSYTTALEPHKQLFRQVIDNRGASALVQHFQSRLLPYIERNLTSYHVDPAVIPYINSYIVSGLSCLLREWSTDEHLSAQQLALLGYNLTVSAIKLDNYRDIMRPDPE